MRTENLMFHVTVDNCQRCFWMDGPDGPNAVRLHYEIVLFARDKGLKLREYDIWAPSREVALAEVQTDLHGYSFLGSRSPALKQASM
jgi:hypothetical protein